ncbi:MAG: GspMb/PilO family protein [Planctomycetota bacterium]|jgi:Tfp pilus assembly protein PilO
MSLKTYRKYFTIVAVIWAGCLIPFALIFVIALAPQQKSKRQIENQLAGMKQTYDSAKKAGQEETKTKQKEEIENLRNQVKDFMVDFEDSANVTFDISQIANEKKVSSFSIKMQEGNKEAARTDLKHLQENQINISFEGDFNQFATFLNALERHRPVVFVDKFKIARSQREDTGHKVNMRLAVFVRKQQDS